MGESAGDQKLSCRLVPHQKIHRGLSLLLQFTVADQEEACLQATSRRYEQVGLRRLRRDWFTNTRLGSRSECSAENEDGPTTTELIGSGIRIAVT